MAEAAPELPRQNRPGLYQITFVTLGEKFDVAVDFKVYSAWFDNELAAHKYARERCMDRTHEFKLCYVIGQTLGLFVPVPVMQQADVMPGKTEEEEAQESHGLLHKLMNAQLHI
jgi:hypothetical protein